MNAKQQEIVLMLIKQNERLYITSMNGSARSTESAEIYKKISHYEPGDWVVMWLTLPENDPRRLGRLILDRTEVINPEDPDEDNHARDRFWYIELVDGRLFKWSNVQPIKVLRYNEPTPKEKAAWVKEAIKRHNLEES